MLFPEAYRPTSFFLFVLFCPFLFLHYVNMYTDKHGLFVFIYMHLHVYILDLYWRWVTRSKRQSLWLSCNKVRTAIRSVTARNIKQDVFVNHKYPRLWSIPKMAKVTRTNTLIQVGRSCHKKMLMCNMKALISIILL